MKCPKCEYESGGWNSETFENEEGDCGRFFTVTNGILAERQDLSSFRGDETATIYFCPKCGISFIEV